MTNMQYTGIMFLLILLAIIAIGDHSKIGTIEDLTMDLHRDSDRYAYQERALVFEGSLLHELAKIVGADSIDLSDHYRRMAEYDSMRAQIHNPGQAIGMSSDTSWSIFNLW